jgi:N-acetylneuraminic acid mutarotase
MNVHRLKRGFCLFYCVILFHFLLSCENGTEKPEVMVSAVTPEAAGIGSEIKIKGSGFGHNISDVKVFFNQKLAEVLSVEDTLIVTQVPPAATTGTILINVGADAEEWSGVFNVLNGRWTRLTDMPGIGRAYPSAFALNGKGYMTGGADNGNNFNELYEYDPSAKSWTEKARFPGSSRHKACVFTIGDKAYVGMGSTVDTDSLEQIAFYQYDPAVDQWTKKANFPGGALRFGVWFSINGKGYAGLGRHLEQKIDFFQYDPESDTWTKLNSDIEFEGDASLGFVIDDIYYGGAGAMNEREWWKYDPQTDHWTRLKDVPFTSRPFETGFSVGSHGYVSRGTTDVWEYDASNDSWVQKTSDPGRQITFAASSFSIGNKAYVGGGLDFLFTNKFFEFDPQ